MKPKEFLLTSIGLACVIIFGVACYYVGYYVIDGFGGSMLGCFGAVIAIVAVLACLFMGTATLATHFHLSIPNAPKIIGISIFAIFLLHLGFNCVLLEFGDHPCLPGDRVSVSSPTADNVFWGYFRAAGQGVYEITDSDSKELLKTTWDVEGRELPKGGRWDSSDGISKEKGAPDYSKGHMAVYIHIPEIPVSHITRVKGQVTVGGFVPYETTDEKAAVGSQVVKSEPVELTLFPKNMKWVVRQNDWAVISIFGALATLFVTFGLKKTDS